MKTGNAAYDLLFGEPPLGGFPDSTLFIGTEFEVGGCYETWGFVVKRREWHEGGKDGLCKLKTIATHRTLGGVCEKAREVLRGEFKESSVGSGGQTGEKCYRCGENEMAMYHTVDGENKPLCMVCFTKM